MTDPVDLRFFRALEKACGQCAEVDEPLRHAIRRALETGDPKDLAAARVALDEIENAVKDSLLRQVHRHMASDLSAIWDAMPGAPTRQRPN